MARIANCEFKPDGCDDPRCKAGIDGCILGQEERRLDAIRIKKLEQEVDEEAERLAKSALKRKGIRSPTRVQIQKLVQNPEIRVKARALLESIKALQNLKL